MLSACAAKSGWVGVAGARLGNACLQSSAGKASLPPRKQKRFTLRDRSMLYCGELMMLMLIMCIDISVDAIIYGESNHRKGNIMTIKRTLAQLTAMGCKATYSKDWEEYRVTLPNLDAKREEAIAYYTSDAEDALSTGAAMKGLG
jgi:hypothetical protein